MKGKVVKEGTLVLYCDLKRNTLIKIKSNFVMKFVYNQSLNLLEEKDTSCLFSDERENQLERFSYLVNTSRISR